VSRGFFTQYLGFGWGSFQRGRGNLGIEVGRDIFNYWGEASQAVLSLLRTDRFPSTPDSPPLPMTGDKLPRSSQGPDASDRRSGGVERIDPGRIRLALKRPSSGQALNRAGSGGVGHGPWEQVLI